MHILQSHDNNISAIFALLCFAQKSSELLYIIEIFIGLNLLPINIVFERKRFQKQRRLFNNYHNDYYVRSRYFDFNFLDIKKIVWNLWNKQINRYNIQCRFFYSLYLPSIIHIGFNFMVGLYNFRKSFFKKDRLRKLLSTIIVKNNYSPST